MAAVRGPENSPQPKVPLTRQLLAAVLELAALAPMVYALDALERRDYLAGGLLLLLTWVLARTGLDLLNSAEAQG